jgi:hypothetical protein
VEKIYNTRKSAFLRIGESSSSIDYLGSFGFDWDSGRCLNLYFLIPRFSICFLAGAAMKTVLLALIFAYLNRTQVANRLLDGAPQAVRSGEAVRLEV